MTRASRNVVHRSFMTNRKGQQMSRFLYLVGALGRRTVMNGALCVFSFLTCIILIATAGPYIAQDVTTFTPGPRKALPEVILVPMPRDVPLPSHSGWL